MKLTFCSGQPPPAIFRLARAGINGSCRPVVLAELAPSRERERVAGRPRAERRARAARRRRWARRALHSVPLRLAALLPFAPSCRYERL